MKPIKPDLYTQLPAEKLLASNIRLAAEVAGFWLVLLYREKQNFKRFS